MAPKRRKSSRNSERKSPDHPDAVFPLVLTSATQELLGCRADEDVTRDNPYKLLKKDDIVRDMKTKAAVSDFSPVKQNVLDYPEETMLLVYDWNFTYGQSFYLVLTPEARDRIFSPEPPEEVQEEVLQTPEPKPWVSLGSEQEIDEQSVSGSREKLHFEFSRVRRRFGLPASFSDHNATEARKSSPKCPSSQDGSFSIKQVQRDCGTQVEQKLQSSTTQTLWKVQKNFCTQYEPNQLSDTERTTVVQSHGLKTFCSSVLTSVSAALQEEANMNMFSDDWKALQAADAGDWALKASETLTFFQAFSDQRFSKGKKISSVKWHPTCQGVVAVALTDMKEEQWAESSSSDVTAAFIVFYCFSDPSSSQVVLEAPDDVLTFDFCPLNPNIVGGGCVNGQVVLWDVSSQASRLQEAPPGAREQKDNHRTPPVVSACSASPPESSHRAPVTDLHWLPHTCRLPGAEGRKVTRWGLPGENKPTTSVQVVTCSPDRTVLFWDVRIPNLAQQSAAPPAPPAPRCAPDDVPPRGQTWKPLLRVLVSRTESRGQFVPLKISLQPSAWSLRDESCEFVPESRQSERSAATATTTATATATAEDDDTSFYLGTEDGEVVDADWKLLQEESSRSYSTRPRFSGRSHQGAVNTVQRSPFFRDVVLTVGGRNFAIWKDDVKGGPVLVSPGSEQDYTAGCWSPSRPALFFVGRGDGGIEAWNLLADTCAPSHVFPYVTKVKVTCLQPRIFSPRQQLLAVADLGTLRLFELPPTLRAPVKKESLNVSRYFELERRRLLDRLQTQEVCEQRQQGAGPQGAGPQRTEERVEDCGEVTEDKEYREYLELREALRAPEHE